MRAYGLCFSLICATLTSCQARRAEVAPPRSLSAEESALSAAVFDNYADLAYAGYRDSADGVERLLLQVNSFLETPSAAGLDAAREAWLQARRSYPQTEAFRFYDGPIDEVETLVNTWPIDENFVESGNRGGRPGIIEDRVTYPVLSSPVLAALNLKEGETSVSTGYHVIEFLLWGQDLRPEGPGNRAFTDYVTQSAARNPRNTAARPTATATEPNAADSLRVAERRGAYLRAATELLLEELTSVGAAWAPGMEGNYRSRFLKLPRLQALGLVLKGLGALSGAELSGERMTVAYETKDQENEHSCFSDNTHADLIHNALGLQNVCLGRYQRINGGTLSGAGICDLVKLRDLALGQRLQNEFEQSVAGAKAIPAPFDQALLGDDSAPGRQAIARTIAALRQQTTTLAEVAALFDVRVALAAGVGR